jgi:hypothetical protein
MLKKLVPLVPVLALIATQAASAAAIPGTGIVTNMNTMISGWGAAGVPAILAIGGIAAWFGRDFIHDLMQSVGKGVFVGILCVMGATIVTFLGLGAANGAVLF